MEGLGGVLEFFPNLTRRFFAFGLLPFAVFLRALAQTDAPASPDIEVNPARAIVQLLAIGPGRGEKKQECAATGFLVNDDGYILTNAHVVEDARRCLASSPEAKIVAKFGSGDSAAAPAMACDVVAVDAEHDLAVLKTELPLPAQHRGAFLRLDPEPVSDGRRVAVTGHPAFVWQPQTRKGRVIGRVGLALNERSARRSDVLVINIPLRRGASGSPVYLPPGAVIGIIERQRPSQPSQTVAVPIRYAIELLDLHGIGWRASRD